MCAEQDWATSSRSSGSGHADTSDRAAKPKPSPIERGCFIAGGGRLRTVLLKEPARFITATCAVSEYSGGDVLTDVVEYVR